VKEYLFDSSALLALIKKESRGEVLLERVGGAPPIIDQAAIHTVHVAEVVKKLVDVGRDGAAITAEWIEVLNLEVIEGYTLFDALNTASLCPKELKLSLGDRIGLSFAKGTGGTAVTTDAQWKTVADSQPALKLKVMHLR
jgi:PIN domain nuclease of toxin-antitoxin system